MDDTFTISTDKSLLDIPMIHDFLSNRSYWAKGRSIETVQRSIDNSLCFGIYNTDEQQIGFARVVTDYAIYGYLMDVFILEAYRGKGIGKSLIAYILQYPDIRSLRKIALRTGDAHRLYSQFGFVVCKDPENNMERYL